MTKGTTVIPTAGKAVKMDACNLADTSTGETMESMIGKGMVHIRKDSNKAILSTDEYVIIDSKALDYTSKHFSPVDRGRILTLANMTYGPYNIIHLDGEPVTDDALMKILGYSRNKYADFMKRLYQKSIVYYLSGINNGKEAKWIMLNPYLARKRKSFSNEALEVFENISRLK